MKTSFVVNPPPSPPSSSTHQRIKVTKRSQVFLSPAELKKSMTQNGEALKQESALTQDYKERNERNIIKCRFLYNKLNALGNIDGVPEMIGAEVSEIDVKIKELEFQLHFKRSHQLKKLRKRVSSFLEQINFEVPAEDMEKIEDQIEIVLFLLDIFEEKFNQMTAERKEITDIISRLEEGSSVQPQEMENYRRDNENLLQKVSALETELNKLKNEDMKKFEAELLNRQGAVHSESQVKLGIKMQQLQKANMRIQELTMQIKAIEGRYQILQTNMDRKTKQEAKWKERYRLMETQKDERIKLLESSSSGNKIRI